VREKGLEPPRLTALEPKSSASTNFATLAFFQALNYSAFIETVVYFFMELHHFSREPQTLTQKNAPQTILPLPDAVESAIIGGYEY
jgi:hypothetical protein